MTVDDRTPSDPLGPSLAEGARTLHCGRCGHTWLSKGARPPKRCPKCHSGRWSETAAERRTCAGCGTTWTSSDEQCPHCGRPIWAEIGCHSYQCSHCGHSWISRSPSPRRCPSCKSTKWMSLSRQCTCRKCGHTWRPRSSPPTSCPACRSSRWDQDISTGKCARCGHEWRLYGDALPQSCPRCRSKKWNGPTEARTGLAEDRNATQGRGTKRKGFRRATDIDPLIGEENEGCRRKASRSRS